MIKSEIEDATPRPEGRPVPRRGRARSRARLAAVGLGIALSAAACLPTLSNPPGPPPPPSPGVGAALSYATAQLGKPYCYAGAGPSCFDCSGLTMQAWAAGGIVLPHFSGAQFSMFRRVPMDQLMPGDLLFPPDPNQHVAIYIGGGLLIHATHPGDVVRIDTLANVGITMAVRPH